MTRSHTARQNVRRSSSLERSDRLGSEERSTPTPTALDRVAGAVLAIAAVFALAGPALPALDSLGGRVVEIRVGDLALVAGVLLLPAFVSKRHIPASTKAALLLIYLSILVSTVGLLLDPSADERRLLYGLIQVSAPAAFVVGWALGYSEIARRTLLRWSTGASVLVAAWAIVQIVTSSFGPALVLSRDRTPVSYGLALVSETASFSVGFGFFFVTVLGLARWDSRRKGGGAMALVGLACLPLSGSRAAFLAVVAALVVFVALSERIAGYRNLALGAVAVAGTFFVVWSNSATGSRFQSAVVDSAVGFRASEIWLPLMDRILERPLYGWGPGQLGSGALWPSEAHNLLLRILVDGGLILLLAFAYWVASIVRDIQRSRELARVAAEEQLLQLLAMLLLAGALAAGLVHDSLSPRLPGTMVPLFLGVAVASLCHGQRRRSLNDKA